MIPVKHIYFDYQATTPMESEVIACMIDACETNFANPHSRHYLGLRAESELECARSRIAKCLKVRPHQIFFTSGATEANNLALKGTARRRKRGHLISSATEHKSVLMPLERLSREGFEVTILPVDSKGSIDPDSVKRALRPDTFLISLMMVNNEIGTIHPIKEMAEVAHQHGALLHCDATQGLPHLPCYPQDIGIDLMSCSAHKIYGPKGVGLLYLNTDRCPASRLLPELDGGGQESALRAGTSNLPAIIGFAKAFEILDRKRDSDIELNHRKRTAFLSVLLSEIDLQVNGAQAEGAPGNLNIRFEDPETFAEVSKLDHLMFSNGSACNAKQNQESHVLKAIGLSSSEIKRSIRFGFGRFTSMEEVVQAANTLVWAARKRTRRQRVLVG